MPRQLRSKSSKEHHNDNSENNANSEEDRDEQTHAAALGSGQVRVEKAVTAEEGVTGQRP